MLLLKTLFAIMLAVILLSPAVAQTRAQKKADGKSSNITLYGEIDELSYLCSSAGLRISGGKLPAIVDKICLGSSAAYSGLRCGDKVLSAKWDDNSITLGIERKGQKYQALIATNVKGLKSAFESRKIKFSVGDSPFDTELRQLGKVKVVILLDRSLSMGDSHAGVPGDISKWMWCKEQIDNVYLATDRVLEEGFDIVLFNDRIEQRNGVTLWDLRQVFESIRPAGEHKNIALPLNSVLNDYFSRSNKSRNKPCIVLVITDGIQNTGTPLQEVLIEASKNMRHPGEVVVSFLQVGDSIRAEELFDDLERNLVAKGARYNMAVFKPFSELRNRGVLYELLQSVKLLKIPPVKAEK